MGWFPNKLMKFGNRLFRFRCLGLGCRNVPFCHLSCVLRVCQVVLWEVVFSIQLFVFFFNFVPWFKL